ncbi:MAG: thiamine pyrophosphate-binding protein, partial [Burkholderiales bacterium]
MNPSLPTRSGGQILVDQLCVHGVDTAFCVPGESYLAVLDALYDHREALRLIVCRQEGGAAFMAEAYGKLTGKPGVCIVTRGPGATNASIGVHTAFQDSTPLILFIGQVGGDVVEREAFQEMDYRRMFGPMAKWVAQIDRADRIPELVSHAFHTAVSGRPGPVVLALPEDMLSSQAAVADAKPYKTVKPHPGVADMEQLRDMLAQAHKPLVILGGGDWSAQACNDIRAFIESNNLPAGCSFRRQDLLDNRHPNYCGEVG